MEKGGSGLKAAELGPLEVSKQGCTEPWDVEKTLYNPIWAVVKIMVPFWIPAIIRHLIFRVPKTEP